MGSLTVTPMTVILFIAAFVAWGLALLFRNDGVVASPLAALGAVYFGAAIFLMAVLPA